MKEADLQRLADAAGVDPSALAMFGPVVRLLGALLEERDGAAAARPDGAREAAPDALAIEPTRLYSAKEAAALLGFSSKRDTMSEIPETDLPRCRVGPARGGVRYLGADLLAYAKGAEPVDTQALLDGARDRLAARLSQPSTVRPIPGPAGTGRRRIQ